MTVSVELPNFLELVCWCFTLSLPCIFWRLPGNHTGSLRIKLNLRQPHVPCIGESLHRMCLRTEALKMVFSSCHMESIVVS